MTGSMQVASHRAHVRLASDVGGTFTDIATFDEQSGTLYFGKTLTTPDALIQGISRGVELAGTAFDQAQLFLHGTTVAINAILQRRGARTALITTQGFRDIYEIGRVNRPQAYNLFFRKHRPLVERAMRFEVRERVDARGNVLEALDEAALIAIGHQLREAGVEAVAVLFLHSYLRPAHEQRATAILQELLPDAFISASHEISQEYREYERTSTVAANAYVGPHVRRYLAEIGQALKADRFNGSFLIVQSTGGLFDAGEASTQCIRMLESGPAAGVVGAQYMARQTGLENVIAFDMGGTTAKAGVIHRGEILMNSSAMIGGYAEGLPVQIPMIDIQEVGTGGGSVAYLVAGGGLRVGPRSAQSIPGPACYALGGTEPTVTDANLVLGRLAADRFLGGTMVLDVAAAEKAIAADIAIPLKMGVAAAAEGMIRIAVSQMANVVRWVTTERGLDATDFALVAYGGAGPLHASLVARELRMKKVIIPRAPGHFSAFGMLVADLRRDFVRTWFTTLHTASLDEMEAHYVSMEAQGRLAVKNALSGDQPVSVRRYADMRYVGQEHSVTVELALELFANSDREGMKRSFDDMHARRYGYASPNEQVEIASLRSSVEGLMTKPVAQTLAVRGEGRSPQLTVGSRPVYFSAAQQFVDCKIYWRDDLMASDRIEGPALVEEFASTTVVCPGDTLTVDEWGNLQIDIGRVGR